MLLASETEHGSRWAPSFILATKSWHVACLTSHHRASNIPGVRGQRPREMMSRGEAAPCAPSASQDPYRSREAEVGSHIKKPAIRTIIFRAHAQIDAEILDDLIV